MITLIEAHNFRCLRDISQPLRNFQILIGANGSGKTTFLDTLAFLSDLVVFGPEQAVAKRTDYFPDLVWQRQANTGFELAIEAQIPEVRRQKLAAGYDTIRYEVKLGLDAENSVALEAERILLKQAPLFPQPASNNVTPPATILTAKAPRQTRTVIHRTEKYDYFYLEPLVNQQVNGKSPRGKGFPPFSFGAQKSLLNNLPDDETLFPATSWFKKLLSNSLQPVSLNNQSLRQPSLLTHSKRFNWDGSHLPHIINQLKKSNPHSFHNWLEHINIAFPDISDIEIIERPDNKQRHLVINYRNKLKVPSWLVSDGTLRFLALTVLAYLKDLEGALLIEEPENGIHPRAIELVFDSLSCIYHGQVFLATHSPIILSQAKVTAVLCLAQNSQGATDIVRGDFHPNLQDWQGQPGLDIMFASGALSE